MLLDSLGLVWRWLVLVFMVGIVPGIFALLAGGWGFAISTTLIVGIWGLVMGCWVEGAITRRWLSHETEVDPAFSAMLTRLRAVVDVDQCNRPVRVLVFGEASQCALICRGWFSSGTVFLSRGMLTGATQDELIVRLRELMTRCREPKTVLLSVVALLNSWVAASLNGTWNNALFHPLNARSLGRKADLPFWSGVRALLALPLVRALHKLGGSSGGVQLSAHLPQRAPQWSPSAGVVWSGLLWQRRG